MQQPAAIQIVWLAQIEVERALQRFSRQPQPLLFARQILLQRRERRLFGHGAERFADDQLLVNQSQRQIVAETEDRLRRLVQFRQAGQRAVAQSRQCFGQSHGLDHMRGRDVNVFLAQQPRHARHPSNRHGVARGPQMVIPAGRFDARAVATVV